MTPTVFAVPEEVFLMVLDHLPHVWLPNLARVCRHFYDYVVPRLYHSIYYPGLEFSPDKYGYDKRPLQTRIRSIGMLIRTLQSDPSIASFIKEASLEWRHDEGLDETLAIYTGLLPPSIKLLPVSTPKIFAPAISSLITSLTIGLFFIKTSFGFTMDREKLFTLFSMPRLLHLTIFGGAMWDDSSILEGPLTSRYATSNVTSLCFHASVPTIKSLAQMLKWVKQLKSLHILVDCVGAPMSWNFSSQGPSVDAADFIQSIETHAETLQELFITIDCLAYGRIVDLSMFSALSKVGLFLGAVMNTELHTDEYNLPDLLPPKLETLQIEVENEWDSGRYGGKVHGMVWWLCEVAKKKVSHYPMFDKFLVWPAVHTNDPKDEMVLLITTFEKAEIETVLVDKFEDTLFAVGGFSES